MKKHLLTWIVVLIAFSPVVYLLAVWPSLPQVVPVHFGFDMQPDRMGDKSELGLTAGILVVVSMAMYFLLLNLHRFDPKRKNTPQGSTFQKLATGMVIFMAALNVLIIASAKGGTSIKSFLFPLLGLMFAFIGNYMNNIKPNYFAGFRLPWTLNNDENWRRTHQLGGKLWFAGGLLIAVVCLFLKPPAVLFFFLAVTLTIVFIPVVYSYRLFKKGF